MRPAPRRHLWVALLVVAVLGAGVASAAVAPPTIDAVDHASDSRIGTDGDTVLVGAWQPHTVSVQLDPGGESREVCLLTTAGDDPPTTLACGRTDGSGSFQAVNLTVNSWPAPGEQTLTAVVRDPGGNQTLAQQQTTVNALGAEEDYDDDGLKNAKEVEYGSSVTGSDTDSDGLSDGKEVNVHGTDPTSVDTDGDGLGDGVEVNEYESNPTSAHSDEDGIPDGKEVTAYGTDPTELDTDGDGLGDGDEIEIHETNPTEADSDDDGLTDGKEVNVHDTDPTDPDSDDDGLDDGEEIDRGTNPLKADTDEDGLTDGEEVNTYDSDPLSADTDGDGTPDGQEVEQGDSPGGPGFSGVLPSNQELPLVVAALVALVASTVAIALVLGRRDDGGGPDGAATRAGTAGDRSAATVSPNGAPATDADHVPALTDADRVEQLLTENDGRMRQSVIVEELDWSKSKVSRVLSSMEEDDRIRKISIGRENLIARPGWEPDAARSPFESHEP